MNRQSRSAQGLSAGGLHWASQLTKSRRMTGMGSTDRSRSGQPGRWDPSPVARAWVRWLTKVVLPEPGSPSSIRRRCRMAASKADGTVRLSVANRAGRLRGHEPHQESLCGIPLSGRDHQPCRVTVLSLHSELPKRGRTAGRARHHRNLRHGAPMAPEIRPGLRQRHPSPSASTR